MSSFRLRATPILTSFLGLLDLKLGATLITLFAGLNKVAGAYGMLAVVLSGGAALSQPLGQVSMYVYSIASLAAFIWGLKKCSEVRFFFCFFRSSRLVVLRRCISCPFVARRRCSRRS